MLGLAWIWTGTTGCKLYVKRKDSLGFHDDDPIKRCFGADLREIRVKAYEVGEGIVEVPKRSNYPTLATQKRKEQGNSVGQNRRDYAETLSCFPAFLLGTSGNRWKQVGEGGRRRAQVERAGPEMTQGRERTLVCHPRYIHVQNQAVVDGHRVSRHFLRPRG